VRLRRSPTGRGDDIVGNSGRAGEPESPDRPRCGVSPGRTSRRARHLPSSPAGIGTRPPRPELSGRILAARCYGTLVTLDPTGVVLVAAHRRSTVGALFRAWGQPVTSRRILSFLAPPGQRVRVYVDGRRVDAAPASVPLISHSEIVLEVGPYVPPHRAYRFPPVP
jgi:hypothetical protein